MELQPIPDNTPISVEIVRMTDGTIEYWVEYVNSIDGTCEE
jgi:hypothetical protein